MESDIMTSEKEVEPFTVDTFSVGQREKKLINLSVNCVRGITIYGLNADNT